MTEEDHEAARTYFENAQKSGKTNEQIMAELQSNAAKAGREKPITHGLVARNSNGKLVTILDGHFITREQLKKLITTILAERE